MSHFYKNQPLNIIKIYLLMQNIFTWHCEIKLIKTLLQLRFHEVEILMELHLKKYVWRSNLKKYKIYKYQRIFKSIKFIIHNYTTTTNFFSHSLNSRNFSLKNFYPLTLHRKKKIAEEFYTTLNNSFRAVKLSNLIFFYIFWF